MKPDQKSILIRMDASTAEAIKTLAKAQGRSVNSLAIRVLAAYIKSVEQQHGN